MSEKVFKLIESASLKQQIYDSVRNNIISGKLAPGQKLHEEELSEEMGVSRAPLREALSMLDRDGFIQLIPRRGAVVTEIHPEDIQLIWDLRALLEPYAAEQALPNIPKEVLIRVKEQLEKIVADPGNFDAYIESDIATHALFMDYLENKYLKEILKNLKEHSVRVRWNAEQKSGNPDRDMVFAATTEHLQIVKAAMSGDVQELKTIVRKHILDSMGRTMKCGK